jgi:hypothetical protein
VITLLGKLPWCETLTEHGRRVEIKEGDGFLVASMHNFQPSCSLIEDLKARAAAIVRAPRLIQSVYDLLDVLSIIRKDTEDGMEDAILDLLRHDLDGHDVEGCPICEARQLLEELRAVGIHWTSDE